MAPETLPPADLQRINLKSAGIACAILFPLPWLTIPSPPLVPWPFLGVVQFSYIVAAYFVLWAVWRREKQWLVKPALLALFIFLPDSLWVFNMASLVAQGSQTSDNHWMDIVVVVQLTYFVAGYFVWNHFFKKIRPKDWNPARLQKSLFGSLDPK